MNHVLVTGGAGYIGSVLVEELLRQSYRVTVLDSFMYRQTSLNHLCFHQWLRVVNGDIRDEKLVRSLLKDVDIVIPLAALVGAPLCSRDPVGAHSTNLDAPLSMLKMLSPEQCVLMPTTNSAYGSGEEGHVFTEDSLLKPISLYAQHKVVVEKSLMERKNSISFRLATVFGMSSRMRLDLLVNDFTYRAVNDRFIILFEANFKRNYIHVRDVVLAFLHGMKNFQSLKGQIYNVGLSDANLSKVELCSVIKRHLPSFVVMEAAVGQDPDKRNYIVSNSKIEKTGFRPTHSLDFGIQELIKGFAMIKNTLYGNV